MGFVRTALFDYAPVRVIDIAALAARGDLKYADKGNIR
jgi:hypothetical protein